MSPPVTRKPPVDEAIDQDPFHHHQGLPCCSTALPLPLPLSRQTLTFTAGIIRRHCQAIGSRMSKTFAGVLRESGVFGRVTALLAQQHQQWDSLFEALRTLAEKFLPPNWKGVRHPDFGTIEAILLDEGIPLAWIPSQAVLQALFDAPDAAARRRIIGRRWGSVVSDCEVVLSEVSHPTLQRHQPFAVDVVQALRDGHVSAAQALAANLLDSVLRRNFDGDDLKTVTKIRRAVAASTSMSTAKGPRSRWHRFGAYAEYRENQGDPSRECSADIQVPMPCAVRSIRALTR